MKPSQLTCLTIIAFIIAAQVPSFAETTDGSTSAGVIVSSQNQVITAESLQGAAGLTVSSGASAIIDFGSNANLALLGNINNSGAIYTISTNPAVTTANIAATNIYNNPGALLTSVISGANFAGIANTVANLNLSLTATNNIVNAGTISSAANLSMAAGNTITNIGTIMAVQNIAATVASGVMTNAGTIASATGNINIASAAAHSMLLNNINGTVQSVLGNLSIYTQPESEKLALQLIGGDVRATAINLINPNGMVDVAVKELIGPVNVSAGGAHIMADTPNLVLGQINLTGDPTFYNSSGDITLTSDIDLRPVQFNPPGPVALAIVANGNIIGGGITQINVSTITNTLGGGTWQGQGSAGAVILVAGAAFTASPADTSTATVTVPAPPSTAGDAANTLTITGASTSGGNIQLSGVSINTQAGVTVNATPGANFAAPTSAVSGDVTLVAFGGATNNGDITIGDITTGEWFATPQSQYLTAAGDYTGINGNVMIVGTGNITTGAIDTTGNYINPSIYSGTVTIASAPVMLAQSTQSQPTVAWLGGGGFPAATIVSGLYPLYSTIGDAFLQPGLSSFDLSVSAPPNPPPSPANPPNPTVQPPTAATPPAIVAGTVLYLDPQGPNAETVTVQSVSGTQITLTTPLTKYHYQYERIMQQASSVVIYPGAGSVGNDYYFLPPTQNGGTFVPNFAALNSGTIATGAIGGTQAITVATTGTVTVGGNMSLSQNPNAYSPWVQWPGSTPPNACCPAGPVPTTLVPNTLRYPSINITGMSGVSLASGLTISSEISGCNLCPTSINITTNSLTNNGSITAGTATVGFSNSFINVQSPGSLTLSGSGTFSVPSLSVIEFAAADTNQLNINSNLVLSTGTQGLVILSAQGTGGAINISTGTSVSVSHPVTTPDLTPTIINVNTPNLNLGNNSLVKSLANGTIAVSSGYTSDPLTIQVTTQAGMTTAGLIMMRSGGTQNVVISPASGTANLALNARLSLIITQTSDVTVGLNGTDSVFFAQNPSGGMQGIAFQPYVGDVVTGTLVYPAYTSYPYWSVLSLLGPIAASQQFRMVSTYTQQNSSGFVIQAAKQVGLQVSAGVFAKIQKDGTILPSDQTVANSDITLSLYGASKYGNVYDIVVGNEDIVGNAAPGPSITTLTNLITSTQTSRNNTSNPAGGNFNSTTLPVTTRQEAGVLNLVATSTEMVTLVQTVEDHIYGNFYPFFDQSPNGVIATLLQLGTPSRQQFNNLVDTFMTNSLNTSVNNFNQYVVTNVPKILVGETGWASPFPQTQFEPYVGTALPQQNLEWENWYYPAMQSWSANYSSANQSSTSINCYFDSYNEPWKGVDGANPADTAVNLTQAVTAGATTLNVSDASAFVKLNPLSVMLDPGNINLQEIQNIQSIDTANNILTISATQFSHANGGSLHAGTPEEPFFGIWKAEGTTSTNSGTYSIFNLTSIHNKIFGATIPPPIFGPVTRAPFVSSPPPPPLAAASTNAPVAPSFLSILMADVSNNLALLNNSVNQNVGRLGNTILPTDETTVPGGGNDIPPQLPQQTRYFTNVLVGRLAYDQTNFNNNSNLAATISLPAGNSILAPNHDLAVTTPMGTVNIAAGSAVLIVQSADSLTIFNLHDDNTGAVSLTHAGQSFALPVGRQLILTNNNNHSFRNLNSSKIGFRNAQESRIGNLRALTAEFSLPSALTSIGALSQLKNSSNDQERLLAKKLFKTAAAIAVMGKGKASFQN